MRCSASPSARASAACILMQLAQPLIWEARISTRRIRDGSRLAAAARDRANHFCTSSGAAWMSSFGVMTRFLSSHVVRSHDEPGRIDVTCAPRFLLQSLVLLKPIWPALLPRRIPSPPPTPPAARGRHLGACRRTSRVSCFVPNRANDRKRQKTCERLKSVPQRNPATASTARVPVVADAREPPRPDLLLFNRHAASDLDALGLRRTRAVQAFRQIADRVAANRQIFDQPEDAHAVDRVDTVASLQELAHQRTDLVVAQILL